MCFLYIYVFNDALMDAQSAFSPLDKHKGLNFCPFLRKSTNLQPRYSCNQSQKSPQLTESRLPRTSCSKKELCGNLGTKLGLLRGWRW